MLLFLVTAAVLLRLSQLNLTYRIFPGGNRLRTSTLILREVRTLELLPEHIGIGRGQRRPTALRSRPAMWISSEFIPILLGRKLNHRGWRSRSAALFRLIKRLTWIIRDLPRNIDDIGKRTLHAA